MSEQTIKVRVGRYMRLLTLIDNGSRYYLKPSFFSKTFNEEIKVSMNARWHGFEDPPVKMWSVPKNLRTFFMLEYLQGNDPYGIYDRVLEDFESSRPLYAHQKESVAHCLTRRYCILAEEMGTGKTLVAIETIERIPGLYDSDVWYVGPKSGIIAVSREFEKWDSAIRPEMMTYEELVRRVQVPQHTPRVVVFDESSKIKTPTSQRSQAAFHLASSVRMEHGDKGYVILMSGTPAPKAPTDWWNQCEVACPGFLKEGNIHHFRKSLCIIEERENNLGVKFPHIITWLDNENKCSVCGKYSTEHGYDHAFTPSTNEVKRLYKKMNGLVLVKMKKDCLDLPDKQYEVIRVKPAVDMVRTANMITQSARRTVEALTLLRELSDGFQYIKEECGEDVCPNCIGTGSVNTFVPVPESQEIVLDAALEVQICDHCGGSGKIKVTRRGMKVVGTPKDEVFINELDLHEDVGRYIVWGGFTGTVDRLVSMAHQQGWATLRVDGRGYVGEDYNGTAMDKDILLDAMDFSHKRFRELLETIPKLCFVGHPQAGGMALTLTASPTELFYSNSFDGTARMQAEDRFHRAGMDVNRGCTIKDIVLLNTDVLVLENLKKKKDLQSITMGQLEEALT
jgi:hypothetical protein